MWGLRPVNAWTTTNGSNIMSTELKSTKGLEEIPVPNERRSEYEETHLLMTSYWGGRDKGRMVQLTPERDHIQLDKAGVQDLVNTLSDWLKETS
jgi:hypothetical protein